MDTEPPGQHLSPGAAAVQSGVVRIEHRDPAFRYKAMFVSASGPLQYEYELQSDGREVGAIQNGVTTLSNLRWVRRGAGNQVANPTSRR